VDVEQHNLLIVGGGNAGISLGARLLRDGASDIAIVEGQEVHRYRPLLNYVGAGEASMASLERPMAAVMPPGCTWIRDRVVAVDPAGSTVTTSEGRTLRWQKLVLCPGMEEDWDATPGLREAYVDGWAGSTFVPASAALLWPALKSLRAGSVVFSVPPEPAPCGATALKPLFMACDHWRRQGVLSAIDVCLAIPGSSVLNHPSADKILEQTFASYSIDVLREARVTSVDPARRAVTIDSSTGRRTIPDLAYAHVIPLYRAPRWIADSGLAVDSSSGLVDIDPETLQHRRHPSIWAIGDGANVETRPSGGALRPQVDVLAHNLSAVGSAKPMRKYDGYTVMPITVNRRELMLLEVDREGRVKQSAPFPDLTKPRRSTWLFDRYALKVIYFRRILRGKV
jgi:sulfide:quinone oxidoreductase